MFSWPDKLDGAALPADPFTGQPLKYRRLGDGCVVYSIGPNLLDDGAKGRREGGDDICFRLFDVTERQKP